MVTTLRVEDRLDEALNFNSWKARIMNLLEESDVDGYMTRVVEEPTDDYGNAAFKKNQAKAKTII